LPRVALVSHSQKSAPAQKNTSEPVAVSNAFMISFFMQESREAQ
jgi:hypothetical protein